MFMRSYHRFDMRLRQLLYSEYASSEDFSETLQKRGLVGVKDGRQFDRWFDRLTVVPTKSDSDVCFF